MRKQLEPRDKVILSIGLGLIVATPLIVIFFTPPLAQALCVSQDIKGTTLCLPNTIPAFLLTSLIPLFAGASLLLMGVLKKKS